MFDSVNVNSQFFDTKIHARKNCNYFRNIYRKCLAKKFKGVKTIPEKAGIA